jgi:hypothetical protein
MGEMHGRGTWTSGDRLETYSGQFVNNRRHGQGVLRTRSGATYNGQFENHKMNGHGCYLQENAVFAEGQFRDNSLQGSGVCSWHKLATYDGLWRDGRPEGVGRYIAFNKSYGYDGVVSSGIIQYSVGQLKMEVTAPPAAAAASASAAAPDDKKAAADKKKKAPAASAKSTKGGKEEAVVITATVAPGACLGELVLLLLPASASASAPNPGSANTIPNPEELCRHIRLTLRPLAASSMGAGDSAAPQGRPLWLRRPSAEDAALAWSRFPVRSVRFVNGVHAADPGRRVGGAALLFEPDEGGVVGCRVGGGSGGSSGGGEEVAVVVAAQEIGGAGGHWTFVVDVRLQQM